MSRIIIKDNSIRLWDLKPQTVLGIMIAHACYDDYIADAHGFVYPFTITSVNDAKHMEGSLHYVGCAWDQRTWIFKELRDEHGALKYSQKTYIALCKQALGIMFDVVEEGDHIHFEYDEKKVAR